MNHGQRVKLVNTYNDKDPGLTGVIAGTGHMIQPSGETQPIYIVRLDEGFWSHDKAVWHSVIVAHRDSLMLDLPLSNGS